MNCTGLLLVVALCIRPSSTTNQNIFVINSVSKSDRLDDAFAEQVRNNYGEDKKEPGSNPHIDERVFDNVEHFYSISKHHIEIENLIFQSRLKLAANEKEINTSYLNRISARGPTSLEGPALTHTPSFSTNEIFTEFTVISERSSALSEIETSLQGTSLLGTHIATPTIATADRLQLTATTAIKNIPRTSQSEPMTDILEMTTFLEDEATSSASRAPVDDLKKTTVTMNSTATLLSAEAETTISLNVLPPTARTTAGFLSPQPGPPTISTAKTTTAFVPTAQRTMATARPSSQQSQTSTSSKAAQSETSSQVLSETTSLHGSADSDAVTVAPPTVVTGQPESTETTPAAPISLSSVTGVVELVQGLESLGPVTVLFNDLILGVPSATAETTYTPFAGVSIIIPAGAWITDSGNGRRSATAPAPLSITVFLLPAGLKAPGEACGPALDIGPHDQRLALPVQVSLPCSRGANATSESPALPFRLNETSDLWAQELRPLETAASDGAVWASTMELGTHAALVVSPAGPQKEGAGGTSVGTAVGATIGAVAFLSLASVAVWRLCCKSGIKDNLQEVMDFRPLCDHSEAEQTCSSVARKDGGLPALSDDHHPEISFVGPEHLQQQYPGDQSSLLSMNQRPRIFLEPVGHPYSQELDFFEPDCYMGHVSAELGWGYSAELGPSLDQENLLWAKQHGPRAGSEQASSLGFSDMWFSSPAPTVEVAASHPDNILG